MTKLRAARFNKSILLLCLVLFSVTVAVPQLTEVTELTESCKDTEQFVTDPELAAKIANITQVISKFQDKSKLPQKKFTLSEVAKLDGTNGQPLCIIIDNYVYDIQDFAQYHPAGPAPLKRHAGQDATAAVRVSGMPPQLYRPFLRYFQIGTVVDSEKNNSSGLTAVADSINSRL